MSKAIAGIYHNAGFSSIGGLVANTVKVQELKSQGVDHYLAIELAGNNQQKNIDHFAMLAAEGFSMGARFPFPTLGGVTLEQIAPFAHLNGHAGLSHVYLGHEVFERMTTADRRNAYGTLRFHFPNTPIRTYYGGHTAIYRPVNRAPNTHLDGGTWQDYALIHETGKNDGDGLIIHFGAGLSDVLTPDYPHQLLLRVESIRAYLSINSPFNHRIAVHVNVRDDYTNVTTLAKEIKALDRAGVDYIYLRSVKANDPGQKSSTTQTVIDAIGDYNT